MKIEDIIDEVNNTWGEEHEEKRKKILIDNTLLTPVSLIIIVSIVYLSPLIIFVVSSLLFSPDRMVDIPWGLVSNIFNIPYYLFDLRIGIIVSIASVLLSLYVSVGKYADSSEGIFASARRAAYRKFAKSVGYIIFLVFVTSFWHGLLAGYFKGDSFAPKLFFLPRECPDWGRLIVPADMNLSRYGEMPLWVLVFFAWFTISSALMLTYSEEEILVRKVSKIRKFNRASNMRDESIMYSYYLAKKSFNSIDNDRFQRNLRDRFIGNSMRMSSVVPPRYSYPGFKFKMDVSKFFVDTSIIRLVYVVLFLIFFTDLVCAFLAYHSYMAGKNFYLMGFIVFGEVTLLVVDINYLYRGIYLSLGKSLSRRERVKEFIDYYDIRIPVVWVMRFLFVIPVGVVSFFLVYPVFTSKTDWVPLKTEFLVIASLDIISTILIYSLFIKIKRILQLSNENEIKECVKLEFSEYVDEGEGDFLEEPNYLFIPYFYYLMSDIEKIYSDYKSESGDKKSIVGNRVISVNNEIS